MGADTRVDGDLHFFLPAERLLDEVVFALFGFAMVTPFFSSHARSARST